MAITVGTSDGRRLTLEGTAVTIGSSPGCGIPFPGSNLRPEHAVLRSMAGRWFVEAAEECLIPAAGGAPVRLVWVAAGDRVKLTASGPEIVFEATGPIPVALVDTPAISKQVDAAKPAFNWGHVAPVGPAAIPKQVPHANAPAFVPVRNEPVAASEAKPSRSAPASETRDDDAGIPGGDNSAGQQNPAIWALGGAGLVLVGILASAVILMMISGRNSPPPAAPPGPQSVAVGSEAGEPAGVAQTAVSASEPGRTGAEQPPQKGTPDLANSLFTVFVKDSKRDELFRLGTAWAVDPHRLVTSGAIVLAMEELKNVAPQASVRCPAVQQEFTITNSTPHPIYKQASAEAKAAQVQADAARLALEQNKDDQRIDELTQAIVAAEEQRYQAFEKMVDYDVGILVVKESLPAGLPTAAESEAIKAGAQVELAGVPFRMDEYLADPDVPATAAERKGSLFARLPSPVGAKGLHRLLVKYRDDLAEENWSGAPVLNGRGKVIGIYSRPTPPETGEQAGPAVTTHDAVEIERVLEMMPGLR